MKVCRLCNVNKLLTEYSQRNTKHGYRHECKECKKHQLHTYYQNIYNEVRCKRKEHDVNYKLKCNHRNHVNKYIQMIKANKKSSMCYLGCSVDNYKQWLEFQFDSDMSWNNYGTYWTIDHVLPLALFDLSREEEQSIVFNWKNTRPAKDNFQKSAKLQVYQYFNVMISAHRYIQIHKLSSDEYQSMRKSLYWLRDKLRDGKNFIDDAIVRKTIAKMGNPHPSSYSS